MIRKNLFKYCYVPMHILYISKSKAESWFGSRFMPHAK